MEKLIQIIVTIVMGYIFQIMMHALGQKQLGSIIRICVWTIAVFLLISLIADGLIWLDLHTQWLQDLIIKIERMV